MAVGARRPTDTMVAATVAICLRRLTTKSADYLAVGHELWCDLSPSHSLNLYTASLSHTANTRVRTIHVKRMDSGRKMKRNPDDGRFETELGLRRNSRECIDGAHSCTNDMQIRSAVLTCNINLARQGTPAALAAVSTPRGRPWSHIHDGLHKRPACTNGCITTCKVCSYISAALAAAATCPPTHCRRPARVLASSSRLQEATYMMR